MKIFVCWSGGRSHDIATAVKELFEQVNTAFRVELSDNLPGGDVWLNSLTTALDESGAGLFCILPECTHAHWLHFEAGALSIPPSRKKLYPLLFGTDATQLSDTFRSRQAVRFQEDGDGDAFRELLIELNGKLGVDAGIREATVCDNFSKAWPKFVARVKLAFEQSVHPNYLDQLSDIRTHLLDAGRYTEPVFQQLIRKQIQRVRTLARDWSEGEIEVSDFEYQEVLLDQYQNAKVSVISTSAPEYLSVWETNFGDEVLAAHEKSKATSIERIFTFKSIDQVTEKALSVMRRHAESSRIVVYVHLPSQPLLLSPALVPGLTSDFTVIDGQRAIGVTTKFQDIPQAKWYFESESIGPKYSESARQLKFQSLRLDRFLQKHRL
jgi:hypothetical protein